MCRSFKPALSPIAIAWCLMACATSSADCGSCTRAGSAAASAIAGSAELAR